MNASRRVCGFSFIHKSFLNIKTFHDTMGLTYRFSSLRDPTATLHDLYNDPNGTSHDNFPRLVAEHYTQIFHTSEAFREVSCAALRVLDIL